MSGLTKTTCLTLVLLLANGTIGRLGPSVKRGTVKQVAAEVSNDFKDYPVYWNVPSFMCQQYGIRFDEVVPKFGIIQNPNDEFNGRKIVMLYNPGGFPEILVEPNGRVILWNGGVPEQGNVESHLRLFEETIRRVIPDYDFDGLAVIDHELWRPIYRQNWMALRRYANESKRIVRIERPDWDDEKVEAEAVRKFEEGAKTFMAETLKEAKSLRPLATWGYYAFPYCFNHGNAPDNEHCPPIVLEENDKLSWLFAAKDVMLPSTYVHSTHTMKDKLGMIKGRVVEALRLAKKSTPRKKVFVYFSYGYTDTRDTFLTREELVKGAREIMNSGADGYIMWGSSSDFDNIAECEKFRDYFNATLGPAILEAKTMPASPNTALSSTDEVAPEHR